MSKVLIVYGTLKQGFPNHTHISSERYLGIALTSPRYEMYRYGSYPALLIGGESPTAIHGELYEVGDSSLVRLDKLEGVDSNLFERKEIELAQATLTRLPVTQSSYDSIASLKVDAYFFKKPVQGAANCGSFWGAR